MEAVRHSCQPPTGTNRLRGHLPRLAALPCQHSGCTLHGREHTLIQSLQQRVDMSQEWSVLELRIRLSSSPLPWLMQGAHSSTLHLQQELVVLMQMRLRLSSSPLPWLMQGAHSSTLHMQQELVVVVAGVVVH